MKKVVLGIIIVFVGFFLLFNNMGFFDWSVYHIIISWQALLIGIGIVLLFDEKNNNKNAGIVLITIGTLFLLPRIFDVNVNKFFIPIIVIIIGIFFITKTSTKKTHRFRSLGNNTPFDRITVENYRETFTQGIISRDYVFAGSKEKWNYNNVKGIEISSIFSGVELDFTQLEFSQNVERVKIRVSSVFSGVILYVPDDWNIIMQKTGIFGAFSDNRPRNVAQFTGGKPVYLEIEAVFGGGEIKCYE